MRSTESRTAILDVPGARLYCEVRGSGPTLLMISPGLGDCGFYSRTAELLADAFQVVIFDRRGNSRSPLENPDEDLDVNVQSDDLRRVLEALGTAPAYVFGGSGGAIIGLHFASRHRELVRLLVSHEPPLVRLLPDAEPRAIFFDEVYDLYLREGTRPAMQKFTWAYQDPGAQVDLDPEYPPDPDIQIRFAGNIAYFLAHEMRQFASYAPDLEALKAGRRIIVMGAGVDALDRYPAACAAALRELIGTELVIFPGGHTGYLGRPKQFAEKLRWTINSSL